MAQSLSTLGFGPHFERQLDPAAGVPARVAAEHRGGYTVWTPEGEGPARLAGRLRHELKDAALPGAGDWVLLSAPPAPDRTAIIERVLDRRTAFTRAAAGRQARPQVVAANVDLVFAVCGLDEDFNLRRIERILARVWASGAQPVVLLNKADLCPETDARVAEVEERCPGVPVLPVSALRAEGLAPVRALLREGLTVALVGSSGAGKSTLVNALLGEARFATGEVRASDGRGRHVTTHRQLVLLPSGGLLLDTPGMRELALADEDGLETVFDDVSRLAAGCRFADCRHGEEPGCAVRAAVEGGVLAPDRLAHYQQLEEEAAAFELRHDARLSRQAGRDWGQRHREVAMLRRLKGGKP